MVLPTLIHHGLRALGFTLLGLLTFSDVDAKAGNTTCAGNLTDWYTNAVGETACETYQRLRQICNQDYQVPSFNPNTPGDDCNDQLADCCCNSISWALSMLCMNCQWDVISGSPNGIDAGVGAYGLYRNSSGSWCSPGTNQSLPTSVQTAVCNAGIKLDNFLYELFWNDGAWFFVYTMELAGEQQVQYNNNTFTNCNSTTLTISTASLTVASVITALTSPPPVIATSPSIPSSQSNTDSVVGGVVGGIVGLVSLIGTGFVCWRRRNHRQPFPTDRNMVMSSAVMPYALSSSDDSNQLSSNYTQQIRTQLASTNASDTGLRPDRGASYTSDVVLPDSPTEPTRHEDLGPIPTLHRSTSGRLPPAYNPQWGPPPRPQARPLPHPVASNSTTSPTIIAQPQLK